MKTNLIYAGALALCVIALVACAAPTPVPTPVPPTAVPKPTAVPPPDLASLIKALVDVLNAGNVDAAVAFFTDDATQTQQPPPSAGQSGVRTGKEQIRGFYKGLIDDHFSVELSNVKVAGDKITYTCTFSTDSYKKLGVAPIVAVEDAVFEGGKIKSKTITVTPESLAKIQAAMAAAQAKPPPDPGSLIKDLVSALNAGNLDAAMAFYADDVTRTQQPPPSSGQSGVWTGKDQVRGVVKGMIDDHFNVEISNLKVVGDKATYTCTFSTDSYKKMGVAPLVVLEEAVFVGGKIKSQTVTITPESLAKIQTAMAAAQAKAASPTPAPSKTSSKQVLLIAKESSLDMELMLTKEVRVMISMLEKAGFKVVVASISGQPITGSATTLKPDLKLADVKIEDYAGFILPCMAGIETFTETIEIVRKAVALGKPVAAQQSSVLTLSKAGVLSGKQFAIYPADEKSIPEGIYKGAGVVQDGNLITSGSSPYAEKYFKSPDTTAELTQKFIDSLKSIR